MNQDVFLMHFEGRLCFIFRIHCLAVYGPAIFLFSHKAGLGYEHHFTPSSEVVFKGVKWCSWVPCVSHGLGHEHHLTP